MFDTEHYLTFFKKELKENLLGFWLPRCLDAENDGYFNCFTNDGARLVSTDKYIWSQGRFLWIFSKLAMMQGTLFGDDERSTFLKYAASGQRFLKKHVLITPGDFRCVFLTDAQGVPKLPAGCDVLDASIFADCFVVMGFAAYALASGDVESWQFTKALNDSVWKRYHSGHYHTLPYPLSPKYEAHSKPMILTNVCCEVFKAAKCFDAAYADQMLARIEQCRTEVFEQFMDENHLVHEFKLVNGGFPQNLFGQHINPGHVIEDMWFQLEASDLLGDGRLEQEILAVTKRTLETGWDREFGGLFHFVTCDGKGMTGEVGDAADEPQMHLVLNDWGSKLWWVHSEALYTTLLMYDRTGDREFWQWFERVFDYTFRTFPNPDKSVREWIQIRTREGKPQEKVVALPVKDPYHILRNMILIIELLQRRREREEHP